MKKRMKKIVSMLLASAMVLSSGAVASAAPVEGTGPSEGTGGNLEVVEDSPYITVVDTYKEDTLVKAGETTPLAPTMGWSSWNCFHQNIDEVKIREIANAMKTCGLVDAGYTYLNLDDCWQSSMRTADGKIQFDLTNFPSGPNLIKDMNALGMKVGLYSSCGDYTCEDLTASYENEISDAQTFAEWGVEYLKYDYCHVTTGEGGSGWNTRAPEVDYITVAKANTQEGAKIQAETAKLTGNAVVSGGWFVTGLNAAGGTIVFENINVPTAGEYVLTIGFRKTSSEEKYAEIVVNDTDKYETTFPFTKGWNNTGRHQLYLNLKAGNNTIKIHNPIAGQKEDTIRRYSRMGNALKAATKAVAEKNGVAEKPIYYNICEHGRTAPWTWGSDYASSWRISGDIQANWGSVMDKYNTAVEKYSFQTPGHYNDPDMMEVGNGNLTKEENRAHFSLWCMLSAPLVLGNDIRVFINSDGTVNNEKANGALEIIKNKKMISINQSMPLRQCKRVSNANNVDILIKPLENNEAAVCFFNKGTTETTASYDLSNATTDYPEVKLPNSTVYNAENLWETVNATSLVSNNLSSGVIPAHGVKVFKVSMPEAGQLDKLVNMKLTGPTYLTQGETAEVSLEVTNVGKTAANNVASILQLPAGYTSTKKSGTKTTLQTGEVETYVWDVTAPATAGSGIITGKLGFTFAGETEVQAKEDSYPVQIMAAPADTMWLGDMTWISGTDGWKEAPARNKSIEGNALKIGGVTYEKGVGTNSLSEIKVYLGGQDYQFTAVAGIDDEVTNTAVQLTHELWADGVKIYDSGILNNIKRKVDIDVKIRGCRVLTLKVGEGGNGNGSDHGDWANAKFTKLADQGKFYSIGINAGANGIITSNPSTEVEEGKSVEITFTPNPGYEVDTAMVNDVAVSLDANNKYVIASASANISVKGTFKVSTIRNIGLEATASSPAIMDNNSGAGRANDNNIDTAQNGFSIKEATTADKRYLQYDWATPKDLKSIEALISYAQVRAFTKADVLISTDGTNFEKLTTWTVAPAWEKNENVIESRTYQLTEAERLKATKVKAMRLLLTETKFAWGATILMELRVFGSDASVTPIVPSATVRFQQPLLGGTITAKSGINLVEDGRQIQKGNILDINFQPDPGYHLVSATINGIAVTPGQNNMYHYTVPEGEVTIAMQTGENIIQGKLTGRTDVGDITVSLYRKNNLQGEPVQTVTTTPAGDYSFEKVAFDNYVLVVAAKDNYTEVQKEVSLTKAAPVLSVDLESKELPANGWVKEGLKLYYYENGQKIKGFHTISGAKYYFDLESGAMKTAWVKHNNSWYYFLATGKMATGWVKDKGIWYFLKKDTGIMATGWLKDGGAWYYLASSGRMTVGWQKVGGAWYYLASSGKMTIGWQKAGGAWYYLAGSGKMMTGWQKVGGAWYYLASSGKMTTGWQKVNGIWYYLKSSGKMATGWIKDNNQWYYLASSGKMVTGWLKIGNNWYFLKSSGAMATGWTFDGKRTYYLAPGSGIWNGQIKG